MKKIGFWWAGKQYIIDAKTGDVLEYGSHTFSKEDRKQHQWKVLGVSFHHWRNGIDVHVKDVKEPKDFDGGLVWDVDHGTVRQWGGSYYGKLPRAYGTFFIEE